MKTTLGILFLCCFTLSVNAQLLWKISGNGLKEPSYIMGTHHLAPLSIKDTDTTFKSLFTVAEYELINNCTKENLKFDIDMMPKIKPAFLSNNLMVILYMKHVGDFNPQEQMDTYFQTKAAESEKKVDGLETMNFQFDLLFNRSSLKRQAEVLLCMMNNIDNNIDLTKRLTSAYMMQDLNTMEKIANEEECGMTQQEKDNLIDNRNKNWADKLPEIMQTAPTFIAVGALHLVGKNGLLSLLKQQNYTVEPVK